MKGPFDDRRRPASRLIVLSGLDGSGKSTQTALLAERLRSEGIPAEVVWNRWKPMVSALFIAFAKHCLRARRGVQADDYRGFTDAKRHTMRSGWKRCLWQIMVWTEYAAQVRSRLIIHQLKGVSILCDRYVYDTLIDIAINFSVSADELELLMNHPLLALFPRPGVVIFIDIDPETGAARKADGTPSAYLADRRPYYARLARMLKAPVVDGGQSVESVERSIRDLTLDWRASRAAERSVRTRGTMQ